MMTHDAKLAINCVMAEKRLNLNYNCKGHDEINHMSKSGQTYWYYCIASISCHMAIRQYHEAHLISCLSPNL